MLKFTALPLFILSYFILVFFSCTPSPPKTINRSFYHWKQSFEWADTDRLLCQQLQLNTLYIRFFDIIWEAPKGAIPTAIIDFKSPVPPALAIVPCIYIENNVFKQYLNKDAIDLKTAIKKKEIQDLARKAAKKINTLFPTAHPYSLREIQIDCDWTGITQQAYFYFLEAFKKAYPKPIQLSATIRLHQIKYAHKTGIPPVNKGLLMYYNMGKIKELTTQNSILDNQIGRQYIDEKTTYPLPLDLALPIFEWGVLHQKGQFKGIINGLNKAQLDTIGKFKATYLPSVQQTARSLPIDLDQQHDKTNPVIHVLQEEMVLGDRFLRAGDFIRLEGIEQQDLWKAAEICRPMLRTNDASIAFYHWQPNLIKSQTYETLDSIYHYFK